MNDKRQKNTTTTERQIPTENETEESESNTMGKNNNRAAEVEATGAEAEEQAADSGTIAALNEELDAARKQAADAHDRLLRATAEFENYKKRAQRQSEEYRKFANEALIKELLAVVDNLERAVSASAPRKTGEDACMIEGVEMTLNEIFKILKRYHVTPVEAKGKPFDPTYHEAVMQEPSEEFPENTVINELQKGYLLHDRLIRPAMVVVSKGSQVS